jgi:hypothetical protein
MHRLKGSSILYAPVASSIRSEIAIVRIWFHIRSKYKVFQNDCGIVVGFDKLRPGCIKFS